MEGGHVLDVLNSGRQAQFREGWLVGGSDWEVELCPKTLAALFPGPGQKSHLVEDSPLAEQLRRGGRVVVPVWGRLLVFREAPLYTIPSEYWRFRLRADHPKYQVLSDYLLETEVVGVPPRWPVPIERLHDWYCHDVDETGRGLILDVTSPHALLEVGCRKALQLIRGKRRSLHTARSLVAKRWLGDREYPNTPKKAMALYLTSKKRRLFDWESGVDRHGRDWDDARAWFAERLAFYKVQIPSTDKGEKP